MQLELQADRRRPASPDSPHQMWQVPVPVTADILYIEQARSFPAYDQVVAGLARMKEPLRALEESRRREKERADRVERRNSSLVQELQDHKEQSSKSSRLAILAHNTLQTSL
jgi:hypothetical protein